MHIPTDSHPLISVPESAHRPRSVRAKARVFPGPESRAVRRLRRRAWHAGASPVLIAYELRIARRKRMTTFRPAPYAYRGPIRSNRPAIPQ